MVCSRSFDEQSPPKAICSEYFLCVMDSVSAQSGQCLKDRCPVNIMVTFISMQASMTS